MRIPQKQKIPSWVKTFLRLTKFEYLHKWQKTVFKVLSSKIVINDRSITLLQVDRKVLYLLNEIRKTDYHFLHLVFLSSTP